MAFALARDLPQAEVDQLIGPGGLGATTIRDLGPTAILNLRRHTTTPHLIAALLALNVTQVNTLIAAERTYGAAAFAAFIGLPPATMGVLLAPLGNDRPLTEIVGFAYRLSPLGVTPQDVHAWATLPAAVTASHVAALLAPLNPLPMAQKIQLVRALAVDGLSGERIRVMVTDLSTAGQTGPQIEQAVARLRGTLFTPPGPGDPANRLITDVPGLGAAPVPPPVAPAPGAAGVMPPAPGPPAVAGVLPPAQQAGAKVLTGPEIDSHLTSTKAAGRAAPLIASTYPTGQVFTARPDLQLWDDCQAAAAGAVLLPNVTPGQPVETPAQRLVRQRLALSELMTRHPAQASTIQAIFSHDEGATPRPFVNLGYEDTYNVNAHNVSRHILGGAAMQNEESLAYRALYKVPQCGATASAFTTMAEANGAVTHGMNHAAFTNPVNWRAFRTALTNGALLPVINAPGWNQGVCLRKTGPGAGNALLVALPPGPTPLGRPLIHPGGPFAVGAVGPGAPGVGWTYRVPVQGVRLVFRAATNPDGRGWGVYTTFPTA